MLSFAKMYRIYVVWEHKWFSLIIPGLLLAGDLSMFARFSPKDVY